MVPLPAGFPHNKSRGGSAARPSDLPAVELLLAQAGWLEPARRWLYSEAQLPPSPTILDLGCGFGVLSAELLSLPFSSPVPPVQSPIPDPQSSIPNSPSPIPNTKYPVHNSSPKNPALSIHSQFHSATLFSLDHSFTALSAYPSLFGAAHRVAGDAAALPFPSAVFDLVFCQLALLWMPLPATIQEIARVLCPGGTLIALEPDYGGLVEYPPEIALQSLWLAGLARAGADPLVGRRLPSLLEQAGFAVRVHFFNELYPPSPGRFDLLAELPLTPAERSALEQKRQAAAHLRNFSTSPSGMLPRNDSPGAQWAEVAHLPFFLVIAHRR